MPSRFRSHPSTGSDRSVLAERPELDNGLFDFIVGVGLNYNHFDLDGSVQKSTWRGDLEVSYDGLYVDLSIYW